LSVGRALVTGGSRGIGRAVAVALAELGWQVTLLARDSAALEEALHALPGGGHGALAFDVADEEAWRRAAPELGDLAGLVCAAGVLEPIGPIGTYGAAEFRRALDVNLLGTMLAIKTCLPALRRSRGAVVTLSGGGATGPLPRFDAYAASKAAVVRLTENLAVELREDGVRVNSIAPGFVATEIHEATLAAGPELVGADYFERTRAELAGGGVPVTEAAELACLMLDRDQPAAFTGRLVSAQWDPWRDQEFLRRLGEEPELGTLRRIDDVFFAARDRGTRV
jgi:NAD(P)-dependent dehydrogenase (short-subunit alcohol dehydrogenase family)